MLVGSGFRDNVDHRAGVAAVFGVKGVGKHAEFFDGIGRRLNRGAVHEDVVPVSAIDHVIVGTAATAIHRNDAGIAAACEKVRSELRLHAGLELQEVRKRCAN